MRYKILLMIIAMGAPSVFARKKAAKDDGSLQNIVENHFRVNTPSKWKPGSRFIYSLDKVSMTLKPDDMSLIDDTSSYKGKMFVFDSFGTNTDWIGNSTITLRFNQDGRIFTFDTGKSLAQFNDTTYNPLITGMVDYEEIEKANSILIGKQVYVLNSEWKQDSREPVLESKRYVPVEIIGVKEGIDEYPVRIYFRQIEESDNKKRKKDAPGNLNNELSKEYYIPTVLSGTLNSSLRRKFLKMFDDSNPRLKYKNTTDINWELITSGKVATGMTQDEVKLSLGSPSEINRIPTYNGLILQWQYNSGTVITFRDGLVSGTRL